MNEEKDEPPSREACEITRDACRPVLLMSGQAGWHTVGPADSVATLTAGTEAAEVPLPGNPALLSGC